MISIQRDTKIQIDCVDEKITAAYAYGNAEDAVDKLIQIRQQLVIESVINKLKDDLLAFYQTIS